MFLFHHLVIPLMEEDLKKCNDSPTKVGFRNVLIQKENFDVGLHCTEGDFLKEIKG